eukprot:m.140843 g.140843  ORF g.140843 m.140843 type:complete len:401 (-) comp52583_c0_seq3:348-1550(-)
MIQTTRAGTCEEEREQAGHEDAEKYKAKSPAGIPNAGQNVAESNTRDHIRSHMNGQNTITNNEKRVEILPGCSRPNGGKPVEKKSISRSQSLTGDDLEGSSQELQSRWIHGRKFRFQAESGTSGLVELDIGATNFRAKLGIVMFGERPEQCSDTLELIKLVLSGKHDSLAEHLRNDAAQGPHVDCARVLVRVAQQLWSCVVWSIEDHVWPCGLKHVLHAAEVADLDETCLLDHDVGGLQVTMCNVVSMQEGETVNDLRGRSPHETVRKGDALARVLLRKRVQRNGVKRKDEMQKIVRGRSALSEAGLFTRARKVEEERDELRMLKALQEAQFLRNIRIRRTHGFDGNFVSRLQLGHTHGVSVADSSVCENPTVIERRLSVEKGDLNNRSFWHRSAHRGGA